ncbi:PRKC apoptosis WT1 regulator protein-like isoform X1 [Amphibalanus amphitrite]|uniref:PRKC apoptosis WT1 regulator protein-like isoform X1 n=1 Tax=Amphibalanus amphitrite TaxID=1232801 RepID=UPI001C902157|nr:PRKC apoptosis WT1 regulator protein-like isoform X1 [Amphibalanus amphitrite]XP_043209974.1 PRKC apoptosis WT1 regulator protein-like isoform X1 [Amphibalanus amphitrite]
MSSATMASSSVSQEDAENEFEKSSRRSRIRMARGRDVRGHQPAAAAAAAACKLAEAVAEQEDGAEAAGRPLDVSGYSGDHDASPKPSARAKDKRPARPGHVNKGKQQRDRRKLREKRRSTGVQHMPSTEVSSTGGSTNEADEELPAQTSLSAETYRNTQQNEFTDPCVGLAAEPPSRAFQKPQLRNKSQSDLDADDEENQETESPGRPAVGAQKLRANGHPSAAALRQLEEENHRLQQALQQRDQRIAALEAELARSWQEKHQLAQENDALIRAMGALSTK